MGYATPDAIILISVLFPVLGAVAIALRFYTRHVQRLAPSLDDWLIVPAWILEVALATLMIWGAVNNSLGRRIPKPDVPGPMGYIFSDSPEQVRFLTIQYLFDLLGVFAFGLIKLSILFFYRKIFCSNKVGKTKFDLVTKVFIGIVVVWTLAFGIGAIFLCGLHPQAAWSNLVTVEAQCPAQLPFLQGFAISDFVTDVVIFFLPIPAIWSLQMPARRRVGIVGVFFVGILALGASAARMAIYNEFIVNAFSQPDGEALVTVLLFWSTIELGLGVFVACLPTLRPLYGRFAPDGLLSSLRGVFSLRSTSSTRPSISQPQTLAEPWHVGEGVDVSSLDGSSTLSDEPKFGIYTYAARAV